MTTEIGNDTVAYVDIAPQSLRKPYGRGRVDIKLSITDNTHEQLANLGVITREIGTDQAPVAKKGGAGSAFVEFAIETILYLLLNDDKQRAMMVEYIGGSLFDLLDNDPATSERIISNMRQLIAVLETRSKRKIAMDKNL